MKTTKQLTPVQLEKLTTPRLLGVLHSARVLHSWLSGSQPGAYATVDEPAVDLGPVIEEMEKYLATIKKVLATREHIPR